MTPAPTGTTKRSAYCAEVGVPGVPSLRVVPILVRRSGFLPPLRVPVVLPANDQDSASVVAERVGRKFYGAAFAGLA